MIFNLYESPLVKPARIFFQADAGPHLKDLQWSGWGTNHAVATGTWILDCTHGGPSCGNDTSVQEYPAKYKLGRLGPCPRFGAARSYRSGTVYIYKPPGLDRFAFPSDYNFCAKPPSVAVAKAAVIRYATRHLGARHPRFSCKPERTDVYCTGRWRTAAGRSRKVTFTVVRELVPRRHIHVIANT